MNDLSDGEHSFTFSYVYQAQYIGEVQSPWSQPFKITVDTTGFIGTSATDKIDFSSIAYDKVIYNLLDSKGATGGNTATGADQFTNFKSDDKIDISDLLQGQNVTAGNIGQYLSVKTVDINGKFSIISIDRDGAGTNYKMTDFIELRGTETTLDELLKNNQIIY